MTLKIAAAQVQLHSSVFMCVCVRVSACVCACLWLCVCTDVVPLSCGRQNANVVVVGKLIKIAQIRFAF